MNRVECIALYKRLSKEDPDCLDESNSIRMQGILLTDYAAKNFTNYKILDFQDDGYSGTNMNRPGLSKLLELVKTSQVDCILVKDFSRFSRNYIELGTYIEQIFPFMGIRFISVNDNFDSDDYKGTTAGIDVSFRHLLADLYSKDLSVKVKTSLAIQKAQGKYISGNCPFGYEKDPADKHQVVIAEDEAAIVRMIFSMTIDGMTSYQIAAEFNQEKVKTPIEFKIEKGRTTRKSKGDEFLWLHSTICAILRNEFYVGDVVYGKYERKEVAGKNRIKPRSEWKVFRNHHEPIISREDFEYVQTSRGTTRAWNPKKSHSLIGKVVCGCCNKNLTYRKDCLDPYFSCSLRYVNGKDDCVEKLNGMFLEEVVLFKLCDEVAEVMEQWSQMEAEKESAQVRNQEVDQEIVRLESELSRMKNVKMEAYERYATTRNKEFYQQENDAIAERKNRLEAELEEWLRKREAIDNRIRNGDMVSGDFTQYRRVSKLTDDIAEALISRIVADKDGNITVEWKFNEQDTIVADDFAPM